MPANVYAAPAPTGGWNAIDSLDRMAPQDAVILDNLFPSTSTVELRNGYASHCDTAEALPIKTLMVYAGGATTKLIAAVNGKLIDASTATPSTLATGYGSDIWSWQNYGTAGGQYLLAANASGADDPIVYDGATVTAIVATGPSSTTSLSQVLVFQERVFYVEDGTLSVWYTDAGAYQGTLTQFDFSLYCTKGGEIAAITTWTRDNGYGGMDDMFVVVTTKGQVLIYQGINPSVSTTWVMVGRFDVGSPVAGPNCLVRTGPDVILICADGYQPLSEYLGSGPTRAQTTNLAYKIGNASSDAVASFGSLEGWQGIAYPRGTAIYINVPQSSTTFYQHIVNTTTGAWCRYKGMNAYSWGLFNDALYFGAGDGVVYLSDSGYLDGATAITGEVQWSFQSPGQLVRLGRFIMLRPIIRVTGNVSYAATLDVDYNTSTIPTLSSSLTASGSTVVGRNWQSVTGLGYAAAPHLWVQRSASGTVELVTCEVTFELGGIV